MKKFRILMGALALAVVVFFIIACNKEKAEVKTFAEAEIISKEDDMSAYLKQFKEKMQSAAKGDETFSMEDARWHLEAVLNYTYGDAGHQTSDIQCDTFYFVLHTDGDEVTLAQLNEAFEALSYDVEKAYGNCNLPDKSVLAIQTSFESESKDGNIIVRSILSTRGFLPSSNMWFDSTDYWDEYYINENGTEIGGGKCGSYAGECMNSGAPKELTRKLRLWLPDYGCHNGTVYFVEYTNDYKITLDGPIDPFLYDENSPCGYKLFYNHRYPYSVNECIDPDGMNYYLSKGPELIEHFAPEEKVVVSANYCWDHYVGLKSDREGPSFHYIEVDYAEVHCNPNGGAADY